MFLRACYFSLLADERGRGATILPTDGALSNVVEYQSTVERLTCLPVSPRARGPVLPVVAFIEHDGLMALAVVMVRRLLRGWLDPAYYSSRHDAAVREHARMVDVERSTRETMDLHNKPWRLDDIVPQPPLSPSPGRSVRDSY
jgi:hypothetical protein